jgi:mannose-6-phosphate isomerase-like protein (cupin superfamily)
MSGPGKIVEKEWGEEQWIVNRDYCGKRLLLKEGYRCSMHHHPVKDETFYITMGVMKLEIGTDLDDMRVRTMKKGDVIHLPPKTWHRFTGLVDVEFIEFSTHHDDADTVRHSHSEKVPAAEWEADRRLLAEMGTEN